MGRRARTARRAELRRLAKEQQLRSQAGRLRSLKFWFVLPCIAAFLVFVPTLHFGFVGDDHGQIERNFQVHSWSYLPRLLTTDMWSQKGADHEGFFYRPLFSVWLLLFYSVAGPTPWLWHLASVLLHTGATLLIFQLISKQTKNDVAAGFGALLFAVHPIHIEAVSSVSAANELFYTIFVLGSLLLFQESKATSLDNKAWNALTLWAVALLFKETAVILAIMFVSLIWAKLGISVETRTRARLAVRASIPWIITAGVYLGVRTLVLRRSGLESGKQPWREALFSAPTLLASYLKKLVLPWHLSSFYYENLSTSLDVRVCLSTLLIVTLVLAVCWAAYRREYFSAVGGALIFLPLLPILGGLRVYEHGNIAHDRYLYLPSAGLCCLVGILVDKLSQQSGQWKRLAGAVGTIIVVAGVYLCLSQQSWYANDDAYYRRAVELYPQNYVAWALWGRFNLVHRNTKQGLEDVTRAYELAPENPDVDYHYAWGLFETGSYAEAEPLLEELSSRADERVGRRQIILLALSQTEMRLGKLVEAEHALNLLERSDSNFPGLHSTRGNVYRLEGKLRSAKEEFMEEFRITGDLRLKQEAATIDTNIAN